MASRDRLIKFIGSFHHFGSRWPGRQRVLIPPPATCHRAFPSNRLGVQPPGLSPGLPQAEEEAEEDAFTKEAPDCNWTPETVSVFFRVSGVYRMIQDVSEENLFCRFEDDVRHWSFMKKLQEWLEFFQDDEEITEEDVFFSILSFFTSCAKPMANTWKDVLCWALQSKTSPK